ncbi:protein kinase Rad3 [Colletotrichum tofieldiae]|nr:protein kinase Rad3 [Colletotrichum tofieldiae]
MPDYRIAHFETEVSPNNRAGCTDGVCKKAAAKCLKGSLRFGTWTKIMDHESFKWKHWGCVSGEQMAHVKELCEKEDGTFDFDAFDGYDEMGDHPDLQAKIRKAIEQGHIDPEDFNGDPWMNKTGQRGIRGKKPKDWDDGENGEEAEVSSHILGNDAHEGLHLAPGRGGPAKGKKRARKSAAADDEEEEKPKAKRTKKAATKAEDEDEKPKPKAKRGKAAAAATVKAESEEEEDEKPKPKAKRGKAAAAAKAKDAEEEEAPSRSADPETRCCEEGCRPKKAAPKKAKVEESEEEPEAEVTPVSEAEEEEEPAPKKGKAAPKGRKKAAPAAEEKPKSTRASRSRK